MVQKPPFIVEVADAPEIEGETKPYRHFKAKDGLIGKKEFVGRWVVQGLTSTDGGLANWKVRRTP